MNSSRMDRRVVITTAPTGASSMGEPTTAGTTVCTVWAEHVPTRAREINASDRDVAEIFDVYRIRYRTDIAETMTLTDGSNVYQIHGIQEIEGREMRLELICRRVK